MWNYDEITNSINYMIIFKPIILSCYIPNIPDYKLFHKKPDTKNEQFVQYFIQFSSYSRYSLKTQM